jgi:hypothetical protein
MTRVESWSAVPVQTLVTLRRHGGESTKAWTASGPYYSETGVACIRVDIGGAVVSFPLERVSLGWTAPPALTVAAVLDPAPPPPLRAVDTFALVAVAAGFSYVAAMVLVAIASWVLR